MGLHSRVSGKEGLVSQHCFALRMLRAAPGAAAYS
jgi:hypothetical protein